MNDNKSYKHMITLIPSSSLTVIVVCITPTVTLELGLEMLNTTVYTGIGDVPYISSSATVSCIHARVFAFELAEKVAVLDPT